MSLDVAVAPVSNHMQAHGAGGEGDHYPWKFYVNQRSGEKIILQTRADGVPENMRRRG